MTMTKTLNCDVCVIGAGSAGLSVAAGAAQLGARTILFEKGKMGGDCLNYGCVPSKALLAAAHRVKTISTAPEFGIATHAPVIDFAAVMQHVRNVISAIAPHDSVERFQELGVCVIRAEARFVGARQVAGGDYLVSARFVVAATGSSAVIPPIPGIERISPLTNETIFSLETRPDHLVIIGGGPIGVEMAQAFRLLGSRVTILESNRLLQRDEPELVDRLRLHLVSQGVCVREGVKVTEIRKVEQVVKLTLEGASEPVSCSHVLVAAGRKPDLKALRLDEAGIQYSSKGITVDERLRTSNRRVYALGDAIGPPLFTHVAGYQAGVVIRNVLFRMRAKVDYRTLPWVTYTDPELAHVGLTEAQAREKFGKGVRIATANFAENDRARAERSTDGGIKVIMRTDGTIVGASILGRRAGEIIDLWALALAQELRMRDLTGLILPYPTLGEISKAAASAFYAPRLFSAWPRRLVRLLALLG
jgi:pyruvate/2-oxoglutarate dehydrogenase complex dihydrolipoamide dehydrogenase (E3) component